MGLKEVGYTWVLVLNLHYGDETMLLHGAVVSSAAVSRTILKKTLKNCRTSHVWCLNNCPQRGPQLELICS